MSKPKVGERIYIPSSLYLSHGRDDIQGGWAEVSEVREDKMGQVRVKVKPFPASEYSWHYLAEKQEEWRREYGEQEARPDPDERSEFNTSWDD